MTLTQKIQNLKNEITKLETALNDENYEILSETIQDKYEQLSYLKYLDMRKWQYEDACLLERGY